MTVFTHIRGLDVSGSLAGGIDAVMAINAVAHDIHVVEIRR